jgi:hypothetical protein
MEEYRMMYVWKIITDRVLNPGITWNNSEGQRSGRTCLLPKYKGSSGVRSLK